MGEEEVWVGAEPLLPLAQESELVAGGEWGRSWGLTEGGERPGETEIEIQEPRDTRDTLCARQRQKRHRKIKAPCAVDGHVASMATVIHHISQDSTIPLPGMYRK